MSRIMRMPRLVGIGIITVLIVAVLCGFMVSKINASGLEGTTESISIDEGVVTAVVVSGQTILIDSNTRIEGTLLEGAKAEVKYIVQDDGTLLATKIEVEGTDDIDSDDSENNNNLKDNEIEGSLASFSDTEVVVNGQTILIDSNTRIEGTLLEGAKAEVKYIVQDDGTLLATKIEVEGTDDIDSDDSENNNNLKDNEIEGSLASFSDTEVVVNGQTILIDSNTRIEGTLLEGAKAEVKYIVQDDGTLLATKIEVEGTDDIDSDDSENNNNLKDNEIEGSLASFSDTEVVVNGQTILIDSNTRIEGTLLEGAKAEVKYITQADNTLLATKIEVEGSDDEEDVNDDDQDKIIMKPVKFQNNSQTMNNTPSSKGKLDRQGDGDNEDDDDENEDNEDD